MRPCIEAAADLVKLSMVKMQPVQDAEGCSTKMNMQVDDERVFELPLVKQD
jgi:DNA polymerase I-like protein with 3'-5' exonuclease and polymerase domains